MRIGKRLFPYPILNNDKLYSQFDKEVQFQLVYDEAISEDNQYYLLNNIRCILNDNYLLELINDGKAKIVCIVECPETMFRKMYQISINPMNISILLADLNGKVNVSAFVVAEEDIHNYKDYNFIDDYGDYSFEIEKHDILAADDGYLNVIDFQDKDDTKHSSIFVVIKDKNIKDGTMSVDYDSNKITISLPEEQWNMYDKSKRVPQFESMYFSIIAVPALLYALSDLKKGDPSIDMLSMDYKWFRSFSVAYKNVHGSELDDDAFQHMNTDVEAQRVLNAPVTKAINQIFNLAMNNGESGANDDSD